MSLSLQKNDSVKFRTNHRTASTPPPFPSNHRTAPPLLFPQSDIEAPNKYKVINLGNTKTSEPSKSSQTSQKLN